MQAPPHLVEQIRKLYALGESPNPHEAAAAIGKATALLHKYNLSAAELEAVGDSVLGGDVEEQRIEVPHRTYADFRWRFHLCIVIGRSCFCRLEFLAAPYSSRRPQPKTMSERESFLQGALAAIISRLSTQWH